MNGGDTGLYMQAMGFEDTCFRDITLRKPDYLKRLCQMQEQQSDGHWITCTGDIPHASVMAWSFRYRNFSGGVMGRCYPSSRTIRIQSGLDRQATNLVLQHEMIHAYESLIHAGLREWLAIDLYRQLSKKIDPKQLERMIDISTNTVLHNSAHNVLFLLKSLELDLRFRRQLGSTFAYGRADAFSR